MTTTTTFASNDTCCLDLDELSGQLGISKKTLVTWADQGLIDASLDWSLSSENEELRIIHISDSSLNFLQGFAGEYREDTVSRTEARRLLRLIDRNQVQRLLRQGDIKSKRVKGETRVTISSVEDYLMGLEQPAQNVSVA